MTAPSRSWKGVALRLFVVLVLQTAALGWMVMSRADLLRTGTEVTLNVVPVDPRDLFRGDFVWLQYDITTLRPGVIGGDSDFRVNDAIWVVLDTSLAGPARPAGVFKHQPPALPERTVIRGRVTSAYEGPPPVDDPEGCPTPCRTLRVEYGIEQYFVPEGEGRNLENVRNDGRVTVVAAVDTDGRAAIKKLLVDGIERYQEPLF
ncbi:GDYXXLXY domain-containing protein [Microbaculum sp. FT89]|uniref:GDYXXLXY domain-containing protein n=1 Tax=Microbaculum sp. FT89 TaxID=3447298 RepID=UPI003F536544